MKALVALIVMAMLVGCEGHVRSLYFNEGGMENPEWSINRKVIEVSEGFSALAIAEMTASEFDLKLVQEDMWAKREKWNFSMKLEKGKNGNDVIILVDWPRTSRSDLSKKVEDFIVIETTQSGKESPEPDGYTTRD